MNNEDELEHLADLFYLSLEAECSVCGERLPEPEGQDESSFRKWADTTAKIAHAQTWHLIKDQPICLECFLKQ